MKNFFKFLGIISLVLVIGFSMVSCEEEDEGDDNSSSISSSDGSIDAALHGTWKGDAENGTLVISGSGITSPDTDTNAKIFVSQLDGLKQQGGSYSASGGKFKAKAQGIEVDMWSYTVSGSTLTIKDDDETVFTGAKTGNTDDTSQTTDTNTSNPSGTLYADQATLASVDPALIGTWKNNDDESILIFFADGAGTTTSTLGNKAGGLITLFKAQESFGGKIENGAFRNTYASILPYTISGSILTINSTTFTKQ